MFQYIGRKAAPSDLLDLLLLVHHSLPQRLYLSKQNDHQTQVLVYPLLERTLIRQSQPDIFCLGLQILVLHCESLYLFAQDEVLSKTDATF